ncbi:MAG: hypothetical protein HY244_14410, partial [Rhizobiales bacterium]|nr:hypothetical protein [Hyphomicrobiales bacterium]
MQRRSFFKSILAMSALATGSVVGGAAQAATAKIDDYLVEGHVPEGAVAKLLAERPKLKGIALPGMPAG